MILKHRVSAHYLITKEPVTNWLSLYPINQVSKMAYPKKNSFIMLMQSSIVFVCIHIWWYIYGTSIVFAHSTQSNRWGNAIWWTLTQIIFEPWSMVDINQCFIRGSWGSINTGVCLVLWWYLGSTGLFAKGVSKTLETLETLETPPRHALEIFFSVRKSSRCIKTFQKMLHHSLLHLWWWLLVINRFFERFCEILQKFCFVLI